MSFGDIDAERGEVLAQMLGCKEGVISKDEKRSIRGAKSIQKLVGTGNHAAFIDEDAVHVAKPTNGGAHVIHLSIKNTYSFKHQGFGAIDTY